jgi:multisubunit Na+/H+ antiporter MnhF subunit
METFYLYFFIRLIITTLIFLSEIKPVYKIIIILLIVEFGSKMPFYESKSSLQTTNRVIILDTIGSMYAYFQILIIIIENKMFNKECISLLIFFQFLHIISVLNYLRNQATDKNDKHIIPDLFKIVLIGCFLIQ